MATMTRQEIEKLYLQSNMQRPELVQLSGGRVMVLCRRCPEKQSPNEDSAAIIQTNCGAVALIVADGMGGGPLGHKASAIAVQSVASSIRSADPFSDLRPAILDGIEHANDEILDLANGAATTLAVVEIQDRVTRAYQVGDSLSLVIGQRGAQKWKSRMHSPVGYAIESGMLTETDAMDHEERHIVSNMVGSRTMHIEVGPSQRLAARDTVIVASDGLYDNLHLDEIISDGCSGKLENRIERLAQLTSTRMTGEDPNHPSKPDDLTILLYTA